MTKQPPKPGARPSIADRLARPAIGVRPGPSIAAAAAARAMPRRPEIDYLQGTADPIDESRYPGNAEGDAAEELDQVAAGFRERAANEAARRQAATDGGRYFVMCFASSDQVDAFLRAVKVDKRDGDLFVDGRKVADRLGIEMPPDPPRSFKLGRLDPKLSAMVRKPGR